MKNILLYSVCLFSLVAFSQQKKDTLFLSKGKISFISFKGDPLKKYKFSIPAEYITVKYDKSDHLLSITTHKEFDDGFVILNTFSKEYIIPLGYKQGKSSYLKLTKNKAAAVSTKEKILAPVPTNNVVTTPIQPQKTNNSPNSLELKISKFNKTNFRDIKASNNFLDFELKGFYNYQNTFYLILELANNSSITYNIKNLDFNIVFLNGENAVFSKEKVTPKSNSSYLEKIGNSSESIAPNEKLRLVYTFDPFSLFKDKALSIDLYEDNGARNLSLIVNSEIINAPVLIDSKNNRIVIVKKNKITVVKNKEFLITSKGMYFDKTSLFSLGFFRRIGNKKLGYYTNVLYKRNQFENVFSLSYIGLDLGLGYRKEIFYPLTIGANVGALVASEILSPASDTYSSSIVFGGVAEASLLAKVSPKLFLGVGYNVTFLTNTINSTATDGILTLNINFKIK